MIKTESFRSEAHFSPKSETEFENETERDCGIALRCLSNIESFGSNSYTLYFHFHRIRGNKERQSIVRRRLNECTSPFGNFISIWDFISSLAGFASGASCSSCILRPARSRKWPQVPLLYGSVVIRINPAKFTIKDWNTTKSATCFAHFPYLHIFNNWRWTSQNPSIIQEDPLQNDALCQ